MKLNALNNILPNIPSSQDIVSAMSLFNIGKKSVIYPPGGYIILHPIGTKSSFNQDKYENAVKEAIKTNDLNKISDALKSMGIGFSGSINNETFGNAPQTLRSKVKQTQSTLPTPGDKEIGGVSGPSEGGLAAVRRHVTGTPDHVEVEIKYDPNDIEDKDEFMFHTHPELADNNYFP